MTTYSCTLILNDSAMRSLEAALNLLEERCETKWAGFDPPDTWREDIEQIRDGALNRARRTDNIQLAPRKVSSGEPAVVLFRHSQGGQLKSANVGSVGERARIVIGDTILGQGFHGAVEAPNYTVFCFTGAVVVTVEDANAPKDGGWEAIRLVPGVTRGPWHGDPAH